MCFSKKLLHSKIVLVHFALKMDIFKNLLFKQNLAFLELLHSKYFLVVGDNEKELLKELQDMSYNGIIK